MINSYDYSIMRFLADPIYGYRDIVHAQKKTEISSRAEDFESLCKISNTIEGINDPYEAARVSVKLSKKYPLSNNMNIVNANFLEEDTFDKNPAKLIENEIAVNIEKPYDGDIACCTPSCNNFSINRSHSIQKSKILSTIVDKKYSVYQTKNMPFEGGKFLKKVGWKNASTFPGFCESCEHLMFKDSEKSNPSLDRDTLGKLIWRAICFTRYRRAVEIKNRALVVSKPDSYLVGNEFDNFMVPFSSALILKNRIATFKNLDKWISEFESANFGKKSKYEFLLLELDFAPFVGAGVAPIHYDFTGKMIQSAGRFNTPIQHFTFTSFISNNKSYFVFCWKKSDFICKKFMNQLMGTDLNLLSSFIPQIIIGNSDTVYVSPDWWDNKSNSVDKHILLHSFLMQFSYMVFPWWGPVKGIRINKFFHV